METARPLVLGIDFGTSNSACALIDAQGALQVIPLDGAKDLVMKDPRVASRAKTMDGFDSNIGKYTSLAYLEAEKEAF